MANKTEARPLGLFEWHAELREANGLSLALRGVLSLMGTYATTETGADVRPSLSLIADRTGHSRSTMTKHVADAVDRGWLTLTADNSSEGRPNVYQLSAPKQGGDRMVSHPLISGGDREASGGDRDTDGGDRETRQRVTATFRATSTETSTWTSSNTSSELTSGPSVWDVIEDEAKRIEAEMAHAPAFD